MFTTCSVVHHFGVNPACSSALIWILLSVVGTSASISSPSHFAVRWGYLVVVGPNDLCRIPFSLPTLLAFSHEFPILVLDLCCSAALAPSERLQHVENQRAAVRSNAFIWIFASLLFHSPLFDCPRYLHDDLVYLLIKPT